MPKPGYASLTIKEEDARRLSDLAAKSGLSIVAFISVLTKNLPDADLHTILTALEHAESLKLSRSLKAEGALLLLGKLHHYFDCLCSVLQGILPDYWVSVGSLRILKPKCMLKEEIDAYTVLRSAGLLDAEVDPLALLADLYNVKSCLGRVLQTNWPNWETRFHPPPLPKRIPVPESLLKEGTRPTLQRVLLPYLRELNKICCECEKTITLLKEDYPEISKIGTKALRDFVTLFQLPEWLKESEARRSSTQMLNEHEG